MDVETPRARRVATTSGYSYEEKQSILENLDIEVADKKRRFEDYLDRLLKSFLLRQESEVTRIPRKLRGMTVRDFGEKYNGDIKYCMEAMAREKLGEEGVQELDASAKKRKRQEYPHEQEMENNRPPKSARKLAPSSKTPAPSLTRTPGRSLFHSKFPRSPLAPRNAPDAFRPSSSSTPLKPSASAPMPTSAVRPPTLATFNPFLPTTPAFPRKVKRNESLMSVNGSPLENPYEFLGLDEESTGSLELPESLVNQLQSTPAGVKLGQSSRAGKRPSILLRREPSLSASALAKAKPSALLSVPTKDGHIIEFDPLITSPHELDLLEGISGSAKKKAKEDMVRLVQQTLSKWTL